MKAAGRNGTREATETQMARKKSGTSERKKTSKNTGNGMIEPTRWRMETSITTIKALTSIKSQESPSSGAMIPLRLVSQRTTRVRVVGETKTQEQKRPGITKKPTVQKVTIVEAAEAIDKKMAITTLGNMKTRL